MLLLEAGVGASLFWFVHNRLSVYGGQVLHALKLACSEHEIRLTSQLPAQHKPDPQHTVAS
jgi:hypothetical protein